MQNAVVWTTTAKKNKKSSHARRLCVWVDDDGNSRDVTATPNSYSKRDELHVYTARIHVWTTILAEYY